MAENIVGFNNVVSIAEQAKAHVEDDWVALADSKRYAHATCANDAMAIARGRHAIAEAGRRSTAIASALASTGEFGLAVAWDGKARGGFQSVVMGHTVSGGHASVLIARHVHPETGGMTHVVGIVGDNGIKAYTDYACVDGVLTQVGEEPDWGDGDEAED